MGPRQGSGGQGGPTAQANATPKAYCVPVDGPQGYPILLQDGHGDAGVLSANLYFGSVAQGRSRLAGYADVSDASAGTSPSGVVDLKSTAESPFHFELTISANVAQAPEGAAPNPGASPSPVSAQAFASAPQGFEATLVDADLFGGGAPLTNVPYTCWFKR
jgi:hypothetical protein